VAYPVQISEDLPIVSGVASRQPGLWRK